MTVPPKRTIGDSTFSAIGFGAMGLSSFYGQVDSDEERFKVLDAAHAAGCTFWDTADMYGDSEDLIGKWFKRTGKRGEIFLATKFGFRPDLSIDGSPAYVRPAVESSLKRIGVDSIDLLYLHRADPKYTVAAMAEFVKSGQVKHLGLSEVSSATLRRAHTVHPIAALQVEYSPFTLLDIEDPQLGLLATARELGVKIVAYSPLGRGLLTAVYKSPDDFAADDFRRLVPRYSAVNFPNILKLAAGLNSIGTKYEIDGAPATGGQVALAWYLHENLAASNLNLSAEDLAAVRVVAEKADTANGERNPVVLGEQMFVETPALTSE
ncbi:NADP-dependent oxidoreductase domain-containing protein [Mycena metata]|uniref:NADP-dependent oxidoreductase domain-containing protein n=1 Tax=Mycena metata TaxID=1033252 RepID=A0AAD7K7V3_9AGAR|nr:NADP-dependent oxidoreductase domain-containing protein [Mycena metata]